VVTRRLKKPTTKLLEPSNSFTFKVHLRKNNAETSSNPFSELVKFTLKGRGDRHTPSAVTDGRPDSRSKHVS
jgi:hypothetical protein